MGGGTGLGSGNEKENYVGRHGSSGSMSGDTVPQVDSLQDADS